MSDDLGKIGRSFVIGSWRADRDTLSLTDGETAVTLEPRAFQVLSYFAERPGRLVTIDELMDALWPGVVVTPNAVTRVIAQLRKALGDDARNARYIQTVARSGYRLVADVDAAPLTEAQPGAAQSSSLRMTWILAGAALLVLAAAFWLTRPSGAPLDTRVAVLPFENHTGDGDLDYLGEGVAAEVISSLSQLPDVRVSAQSQSFGFSGSGQTAAEFARSLDVAYYIEGSVRQVGPELRITAQLIDVADSYDVWSGTVRKDSRNVFAAQDEVSRQIAAALADALQQPVPEMLAAGHVPNPEAYDLYLRGRYIWHRRGSEPLQLAIDRFAEAVRIDPEFARGWAALASAYLTYPSYSPKGFATWPDAEDAARRALELDPSIPEVYGVLGTFADTRLEWVDGHEAFALAVELDEYSATAHYWYSEHLAQTGRYHDSLRHVARSLEIDPTYLAPQLDQAFVLMMFGAYEPAYVSFAEFWQRGVQNVTSWNGYFISSILTGNYATARDVVGFSQLPEQGKVLLNRFIDVEAGGDGHEQLIDELFGSDRLPVDYRLAAWVGSRLGAFDEVIDMYRDRVELGQFVETRPLWGPATAALKAHPEFAALLQELKLIDYWDAVAWGSMCREEESRIVCDAKDMTLDALGRITQDNDAQWQSPSTP